MLIRRPRFGELTTLSVAALLVALPEVFEATQVYEPALAEVAPVMTSCGPVEPEMAPPSERGAPFNIHLYPPAFEAAEKTTVEPLTTVWETGALVNWGSAAGDWKTNWAAVIGASE